MGETGGEYRGGQGEKPGRGDMRKEGLTIEEMSETPVARRGAIKDYRMEDAGMSNEKRERDQMAENSRVLARGKPRKGRRTLIASCRARKDGKQRGVTKRSPAQRGDGWSREKELPRNKNRNRTRRKRKPARERTKRRETVPQTNTGERVREHQGEGGTAPKELGKMAP